MRVRQERVQAQPADVAHPPALPHPDGWFCVGVSAEWTPGKVLAKPFMDGDIVIYRTRKGHLRAVEPYCPHLGAHLGVGGTVEGEVLVCPFHKFGFAPDGSCTRTPYGKPPRIRLEHLAVRETVGIVWVWHHHAGAAPTWELPDDLPCSARPVAWAIDVAGHPQQGAENAIDYQHIPALHGVGVEVLSAPRADGPFYTVEYRFKRPMPPLGTVNQDGRIKYYGLGGFHVQLILAGGRIVADTWFLATPIGPWRMRYWVMTSTRLSLPRILRGRARRGTVAVLSSFLNHVMNHFAVRDVRRDMTIYQHQKHITPPKLNDEDGAIGPFRIWARQFLPDKSVTGDHESRNGTSRAPGRPQGASRPVL
ncbi:Rieske 2Fe-2S domain-containing protein [Streptomyces hesseae]|uniref:cholesterol 7-desaturase n=1 Tax=Streptomyces hesseae TaxID=3075519 RepID=A0ABU2SVG0_9ACTN|nr:Rieske 2Fe-2S domain-containing protein [Streptomyces sp. DSM 40473]MDT0452733.1 Rieske 2Fe-2S domain-containing protein [Streptomyces sp. DSM 40473]